MPSSFCTKSPKRGAMAGASRRSRPPWTAPSTEPHKRTSPTAGSPALLRASRTSMPKWVVFSQPTSSSSPGDPAWGRRLSPPTSRSTSPSAYDATSAGSTARLRPVAGGIVGFLLTRDVVGAACHPGALRAGGGRLLQTSGVATSARPSFRQAARLPPEYAPPAALHRPDRRALHRPARGPRAPPEASAWRAPHCRRLHSAHAGQDPSARRKTACRRSTEITAGLKALAKELDNGAESLRMPASSRVGWKTAT